jgi:hypothetical protein
LEAKAWSQKAWKRNKVSPSSHSSSQACFIILVYIFFHADVFVDPRLIQEEIFDFDIRLVLTAQI